MKLIKTCLFISVIVLCNTAIAQTQGRIISGVVRDVNGPIQGASVVQKNLPANGTTTGNDGRFSISVKGTGNTIVVTSIGYVTKEVNITNNTSVNVVLQSDGKALDEVVVVGYGTQKKITNTGAVSTISGKEMRQTPSASLQNTLTGKITGFVSQQRSGQPGSDGADFFIRGISTFNGDQTPLILVDDIEYSYSQFSRIDPNEVESLTILKDASTTAIYGIKGANGVVLITTRRGKVGAAKINFRTEYGVQSPTHVPKLLDAYQVALLRNLSIENDNKIQNRTTPLPPEFSDADIEHYRTGDDPYGHPNVNWYNTLFKKFSSMSTNNLDISGGTAKVKYFLSLGFLNQGGILKDFTQDDDVNSSYNYKRYNFRSNIDIQATSSLSFKLDVTGNYAQVNSPNFANNANSGQTAAFTEIMLYSMLRPSVYPVYNPNGSYGWSDPNTLAPISNNIVGRLRYGGFSVRRDNYLNFNITMNKKWDKVLKGLSSRISVASSNDNSAVRNMIRGDFPSFYYNPKDSTYTPRNANVYRISPWTQTYDAGSPTQQTNIQANLAYAHRFGAHDINALLLYNQNTSLYPNGNATQNYIPDNFRGYTLRAGYTYRDKYMLQVSGAYNGTDRFTDPYGLFPAVSAGWNISQEKIIRDHLPFVTLFKLRGSYGIVGSDNTGPFKYVYESMYSRNGSFSFGPTDNNFTGIGEALLPNENVVWEKERKADVGLDFAFFRGKLSGTAEYFDNERYDILARRQTIPSSYGITSAMQPPVNLGRVNNKGYEGEITYKNKVGKVGYRLKGVVSVAKNKIVFQDEILPAKYPWQQETGKPIGSILQYVFDGFYTQKEIDDPAIPKPSGVVGAGYLKYKDLNNDGIINTDDKGYFGKPNLPTTNFGLDLGLDYKGFTISALIQSARDYDIRPNSDLIAPWVANLQAIHLKSWTPETAATAQFPVMITNFVGSYMQPNGNLSDFWCISGNYIRLRSVEVGYQLPEKLVRKMKFAGARIYANGYNLISWSKSFNRYGFDPEILPGVNKVSYPVQAIYNIGISLSVK